MLRDPKALRRADRAARLLIADRVTVAGAEDLIRRKLPAIYRQPESIKFGEVACGDLIEAAVAAEGRSLWEMVGRELDRQEVTAAAV